MTKKNVHTKGLSLLYWSVVCTKSLNFFYDGHKNWCENGMFRVSALRNEERSTKTFDPWITWYPELFFFCGSIVLFFFLSLYRIFGYILLFLAVFLFNSFKLWSCIYILCVHRTKSSLKSLEFPARPEWSMQCRYEGIIFTYR